MNLKFIGTDGSMGLKHGEIYDVVVETRRGSSVILVNWYYLGAHIDGCPYSSPAAFAADWAKPGRKVVVRKKKPAIEDSDAYSKYKRAIKRMKTVTLLDLFLAGFGGGEKRD